MGIEADGQTYTVKLTTEPIGGEDGKRSFLGRTEDAGNLIVIDGTLPKDRQQEVFLHELIHVADATLPEFVVLELGRRLYGILRNNDLFSAANIVARVSDGEVSKAEAGAINEASNQQAEQLAEMGMILREVSEAPWHYDGAKYSDESRKMAGLLGQRESGEPILAIRGPDGRVNRAASHQAAASIVSGSTMLSPNDRRQAAKTLAEIYRNTLAEEPPKGLVLLARA